VPADLIGAGDLEGCFHVHTDWSDGDTTLDGMVAAAAAAGYRWVGISDHSQAASYANGLGADRLVAQRAAIEAARLKYPRVNVLHGIEVDILENGELDLDDATLRSLDFVVASVHSQLRLDEAAMTARLVKAVSHPLVTLLGHPRGRLLLSRQGSSFDLEQVARAARENGTALEINASPERMDLGEDDVRTALAQGASFAINPDAHSPTAFGNQPLGLAVARRARLSRDRVLNAGATAEVLARVASRRASHGAGLGEQS
jgi:DNA polymerase (family 10)